MGKKSSPDTKLRGTDGNRLVSIRINEELLEEIRKVSIETGCSSNLLINVFLKWAMENYRHGPGR